MGCGEKFPTGKLGMLCLERTGINAGRHKEQGSAPGPEEYALAGALPHRFSLSQDERIPLENRQSNVADRPES